MPAGLHIARHVTLSSNAIKELISATHRLPKTKTHLHAQQPLSIQTYINSTVYPDECIFHASAVQMCFVLQYIFSLVCFEGLGFILGRELGSEILVCLSYCRDCHLIFIQGPRKSDWRSFCYILCVKSHKCRFQSNLCNQARQNIIQYNINVPPVGHIRCLPSTISNNAKWLLTLPLWERCKERWESNPQPPSRPTTNSY